MSCVSCKVFTQTQTEDILEDRKGQGNDSYKSLSLPVVREPFIKALDENTVRLSLSTNYLYYN
jgi:hypothetical protein